jgi:serine/threonine protein kinase
MFPGHLMRNFSNLKFIGKGTFGIVISAKTSSDPIMDCAIKLIPITRDAADKDAATDREVRNMRDVLQNRNENLVKYFDTWIDDIQCVGNDDLKRRLIACRIDDKSDLVLCISMELCDGTLRQHLHDLNSAFAEQQLHGDVPVRLDQLEYFTHICAGIKFMHSDLVMKDEVKPENSPARMAHRDLNPKNVLYTITDGRKVFKIGDFGCSKIIELTGSHTQTGTIYYSAPEQLSGGSYGVSVDIYSLGVILLEMLLPFSDPRVSERKRLAFIRSKQIPPGYSGLPENLATLMLQMISNDPHSRPKAEDILAVLSQYL